MDINEEFKRMMESNDMKIPELKREEGDVMELTDYLFKDVTRMMAIIAMAKPEIMKVDPGLILATILSAIMLLIQNKKLKRGDNFNGKTNNEEMP